VRDPVAVVAALAGQEDLAGRPPVELRTERDELAHPGRALVDERRDRVDVADPDARDQGVAQVLLGGVAGVHRRGDAALRPRGRALVEHRLGHEQDAVDLLPQPQGGGEAGDARPDDDDIRRPRPPWLGGGEPTGHVDRCGHGIPLAFW
jgi:hypothetical protein